MVGHCKGCKKTSCLKVANAFSSVCARQHPAQHLPWQDGWVNSSILVSAMAFLLRKDADLLGLETG